MASKELTDLIQAAGAVGDGAVALDSSGGLVRRDSVPYDKDAAPVASGATDIFVGVSVSGEARTFNAIPYDGPSAVAATPAVSDLVVGRTSAGDARVFTVASLATTLEGTSFGTAAFVNTGTAAGEVPLNSDLGEIAYKDIASTADAEAGTSGAIPDAAGVHAAIAAVGYSGSTTTEIWTGSLQNINVQTTPSGGYAGDGWYLVESSTLFAGTMAIFIADGIDTKAGHGGYSSGTTMSVYMLSCSSSGNMDLTVTTANLSAGTSSVSAGTITRIWKIS